MILGLRHLRASERPRSVKYRRRVAPHQRFTSLLVATINTKQDVLWFDLWAVKLKGELFPFLSLNCFHDDDDVARFD